MAYLVYEYLPSNLEEYIHINISKFSDIKSHKRDGTDIRKFKYGIYSIIWKTN